MTSSEVRKVHLKVEEMDEKMVLMRALRMEM